jgi:hypothetical protein
VILVTTALQAEEAATNAPVPRIACDEPTYHFGDAENTDTIKHTFVLKNEGDAPLQINRVRPACGCTVAKLSSKLIRPGEQAEVSTSLSLKGRRGHQRKSITVESNDPQTRRFMLYLEGDVVAPLQIAPDRLFFGQIDPDATVTKTIDIRANNKAVKITGVISTEPHYQASVETVNEGRAYRVNVETVPPMPEGHVNGFIRISRDNNQPDINVPVSAVVSGPLAFAPREIILRNDGGTVTRYVVVRPGTIDTFEVTGLDVPHPDIQVNINPVGTGYRVELANIAASDALNGKQVVIHTDLEQKPEIIIPFKIVQ